jgi:hypothetical protein
MAAFTNSAIKNVHVYGPRETYIAGGRIPFGAPVIRSAAGTVVAAALEDIQTVLGFAGSDEEAHLYPGFWESGELVPVSLGGSIVYALIGAVTSSGAVLGDYLSVLDLGSTMAAASYMGVLGEGAESTSAAGQTRAAGSCAKLLEEVTIGSDSYKVPASTPTAGEFHVHMTVGDIALMGLKVGEYIALRNADSTTGQTNLITALEDDGSTATITFEIPLSVAAVDMVSVLRQAKVLVIT